MCNLYSLTYLQRQCGLTLLRVIVGVIVLNLVKGGKIMKDIMHGCTFEYFQLVHLSFQLHRVWYIACNFDVIVLIG